MNRAFMFGAVAAVCLGVSSWLGGRWTAAAQEAEPKPNTVPALPHCDVALVDVSRILKGHRPFKQGMDKMKSDVEAAEAKLNAERAKIADMEADLAQLKAGTDEYKNMHAKILVVKNDFNLRATLSKEQLMEQETEHYRKTFTEITDFIGRYATEKGIRLVIRWNSDLTPGNSREDVYRALNAPVLFQQGVDITDEVLKRIESQ